MHPATFFIDLDDTVYPSQSGLWEMVGHQMNTYMIDRMKFPAEEVPRLRDRLFHQYGTTLRGLKALYNVDEFEFLDFVHDIPVEQVLSPDPALREMLLAYPQRKFIFTNANEAHARRVLNRVGIADCFEGIIDVIAISPYCKPERAAFETALRLAGSPDPEACVLIDDSPWNLSGARAVGMFTIGVGCKDFNGCCDAAIASLHELPRVIPLP